MGNILQYLSKIEIKSFFEISLNGVACFGELSWTGLAQVEYHQPKTVFKSSKKCVKIEEIQLKNLGKKFSRKKLRFWF